MWHKLCILYMPHSRDDVHIVSTETVRNVLKEMHKFIPCMV